MLKISKFCFGLFLCCLLSANCSCVDDLNSSVHPDSGEEDNPDKVEAVLVKNTFQESDEAFSNPLKGFDSRSALNPYTTLARMDIRWNDIENSVDDGVDKLIKYADDNFLPFQRRGIKLIVRIIGCWPQAEYWEGLVKSAYGRWCSVYWPSDLNMGNMSIADYGSPEFKSRAAALIKKMGQAWDNDPRVAFVNMGIVGYWGEQNSPYVSDVPGLEKVMGDACVAAFKNKSVGRRLHSTFKDYNFGIYYDSFGHADTDDWKYMMQMGDYWKTQAVTGEVAYDWGNYKEQPGENPTESLANPKHLNYLTSLVRKTHTTCLSWIGEYDTRNAKAAEGARQFQKAMGYRFLIPWVEFSPYSLADTPNLNVKFPIVNVGSAPLYGDYKLKIHLLSKEDKKVVWTGSFDNVNSRTWIPGDKWSDEKNAYTVPAVENLIDGKWELPAALFGKEYFIAVSLDDPYTDKPSVRFAQDNYLKGGYTVLGCFGLGVKPATQTITKEKFDLLSSERLK